MLDELVADPLAVEGPARPIAEHDHVDRVLVEMPEQIRVGHQPEPHDLAWQHLLGEHQREVVLHSGQDHGLRFHEVTGPGADHERWILTHFVVDRPPDGAAGPEPSYGN